MTATLGRDGDNYGWHYRNVQILRPPATVAAVIAPVDAIPVADLLP